MFTPLTVHGILPDPNGEMDSCSQQTTPELRDEHPRTISDHESPHRMVTDEGESGRVGTQGLDSGVREGRSGARVTLPGGSRSGIRGRPCIDLTTHPAEVLVGMSTADPAIPNLVTTFATSECTMDPSLGEFAGGARTATRCHTADEGYKPPDMGASQNPPHQTGQEADDSSRPVPTNVERKKGLARAVSAWPSRTLVNGATKTEQIYNEIYGDAYQYYYHNTHGGDAESPDSDGLDVRGGGHGDHRHDPPGLLR